jgi:hypothetical protein
MFNYITGIALRHDGREDKHFKAKQSFSSIEVSVEFLCIQ